MPSHEVKTSTAVAETKLKELVDFPRVSLCHQPTPLEYMPRLTSVLNGPAVPEGDGPKYYIKRDDCTGLATGGNKTRKLEFLIAEALREGADMVVTQGAIQSNHVRQAAAACCKFGLGCHALLERRVPDRDDSYESTSTETFSWIISLEQRMSSVKLD